MQRRTIIAGIALTATATLALAGCAGGSGGGESTADNPYGLVQAGTLTVCSDIPYPPFEFEALSVQDVGFDALQSGTTLAAGTCDIGASAITITEERVANIDFSDPYVDSLQSLLVAVDSGITGIDDLAGRNVGVQQGTTGERYATENATGAQIVQYPSDGELWPAMQAGQIEAILQDQPVNYVHQQDDPGYRIVETYETNEQYGFAFAKGQRDALREAVNGALQELRDSGEYQQIFDTYLAVQ